MITDFYKLLDIYERQDAAFAGVGYVSLGTYRGFIQPTGGGEGFKNGKGGESATHRLYTHVTTPCRYGYKVTQGGQSYVMLYAIQPDGISGTGHHKEVILGIFE